MKYKNTNKWISRFCAVSAVLLLAAVFTISDTFSFPSTKSVVKYWDVYFAEPMVENDNGRVIVNNDRLLVGVKLNKENPSYSFFTSINNDGDFDAKLNDFIVTDLSKIKVGTSTSTGNTYTMADYVTITTTYMDDNNVNNIRKGEKVKNGDILIRTTKNNLSVVISLNKNIDSDKEFVLREYLNSNIELNITIDAIYQQK